MAEIAFFGLGTMGVPMAINLLKAGHHLHVLPHNGHMDGPLAVQEYGACIHETLQETVGNAEFIISVVPDDDAVRDLYLNQAMLEAIRPGTIIIEMTSCSPEIVRAAGFQMPQGAGHLRHRVLSAGENGGGAVGDVGIAVDIDPDMLPVSVRLRQQNDLLKQFGGGQRPHAA